MMHALILAYILAALIGLLAGLVWYALHPPYTPERAADPRESRHRAPRRGRRARRRQARAVRDRLMT